MRSLSGTCDTLSGLVENSRVNSDELVKSYVMPRYSAAEQHKLVFTKPSNLEPLNHEPVLLQ